MSSPFNRRCFLAAIGSALAALPLAAAEQGPESRLTTGLVECQSHLFFPEVLDLMRRRKTEQLVFDRGGTAYLKMGDWLRKVPPPYTGVEAKLTAMDASAIEITMLSTNDHGPEWFGDDGPAVAQLIHDSLAGVLAKHPTRFRGLCTLPLQNRAAAATELDRCVIGLGGKGGQHVERFSQAPGVRVTALGEPDPKRLAAHAEKLKQRGATAFTATDPRRVVERDDVDAVVIATPNHWHALLTVWAIRAGKHVYVEKPVSHSV